MLNTPVILVVSFAYLGLLFAIAYYGDKRADAGRSIVARPSVYALSLAVYATSWTFYGSVGRAADTGVGFLPIYLGPTLMFALGWVVLRKIIRISKANRTTTIADFIASRYGKSTLLGGLVTVIAVIGIVPYISLQLKAISNTFSILPEYPDIVSSTELDPGSLFADTGLYVALVLAAFTILFGTRKLDASRAPRGHGRSDRVRVGGEARGLSLRRPVRHLRHVRRASATCSGRRARCPTRTSCSPWAVPRRATAACCG